MLSLLIFVSIFSCHLSKAIYYLSSNFLTSCLSFSPFYLTSFVSNRIKPRNFSRGKILLDTKQQVQLSHLFRAFIHLWLAVCIIFLSIYDVFYSLICKRSSFLSFIVSSLCMIPYRPLFLCKPVLRVAQRANCYQERTDNVFCIGRFAPKISFFPVHYLLCLYLLLLILMSTFIVLIILFGHGHNSFFFLTPWVFYGIKIIFFPLLFLSSR